MAGETLDGRTFWAGAERVRHAFTGGRLFGTTIYGGKLAANCDFEGCGALYSTSP